MLKKIANVFCVTADYLIGNDFEYEVMPKECYIKIIKGITVIENYDNLSDYGKKVVNAVFNIDKNGSQDKNAK